MPRLIDRFLPVAGQERTATVFPSLSLAGLQELLYNGMSYGVFGGRGGTEEGPRLALSDAIRQNGVILGLVERRADLFCQVRFGFRDLGSRGMPTVSDITVGAPQLAAVARPSRLLRRMEWDVSSFGTAFLVRPDKVGAIRRLDPRWVTMVYGSDLSPDDDPEALTSTAELIGLVYAPAGTRSEFFPRGTFGVHAPIPDPSLRGRGMSWIEAVLTEAEIDSANSTYIRQFYSLGATPNFVIELDKDSTQQHAEATLDAFEREHTGLDNAFRTLILAGGAKPHVIGSTLADLDTEHITRLQHAAMSVAAGVPAIVAGTLPGLESSTYANYHSANRSFADLTARSWWEEAALALAPLLHVPAGTELWPDTSMVAALQDDRKDDADVLSASAATIRTLVDGGFDPASVTEAVHTGDLSRLVHTGKLSVQLQEPDEGDTEPVDEDDDEEVMAPTLNGAVDQ